MSERPKVPSEPLYRGIEWLIIRPIARQLGGVTIHNLGGHEPITGGHLRVGNHPSSKLDAAIAGSVQLKLDGSSMHAIAKSELGTNRLNRWVLHGVGALFIDKNEKTIDPAVVGRLENILDNNGIVWCFPEGTTTYSSTIAKHGSMSPKRNAVALAVNSGVPIETNALSGTAPGDIGNFFWVIGDVVPVVQEPVDMQNSKSIVGVTKPYMSDIYDGMNDALHAAHRLRAEYTAEHPIPSNPVAKFLIQQLSQQIPEYMSASSIK